MSTSKRWRVQPGLSGAAGHPCGERGRLDARGCSATMLWITVWAASWVDGAPDPSIARNTGAAVVTDA
jgi:hypothetical protein